MILSAVAFPAAPSNGLLLADEPKLVGPAETFIPQGDDIAVLLDASQLPSVPQIIGGMDFIWPQSPTFHYDSAIKSDRSATIPTAETSVSPRADIDDGFPVVPDWYATPIRLDDPRPAESTTLSAPHHGPSDASQLWWSEAVGLPQLGTNSALGLTLDQLFALAAQHSARISAIAQQPRISQTQIGQAMAAFDPTLFSNNRFDSTSDPAESTLATGGPPRLEDNILGLESGLQGQHRSGASYTLAQRFGLKDSNSTFFSPTEQGNSKLRASLSYPLLRGRKIDLPRSLVLTATFESQAAQAEFAQQFQQHLYSISETYWQLYQERGTLIQRREHLSRAEQIAERIEQRTAYDLQQTQWLRVRSAVTTRRAEMANAMANIQNLESQVRALVNAPELTSNRSVELLPLQEPQVVPLNLDIESEVSQALANRPEVSQLQHSLQATQVRLQLAREQLKPQLNLVSEAYLAGLREDFDTGRALVDSFGDRPGYAAGLMFEQPVRQRAARQAINQRSYEVTQLVQLIREAEENIRAEVESAIRNLSAAELTAMARYHSLEAAQADLNAQFDRWLNLGDDPRLGQVQLNDLLFAQDRLLQEEVGLLEATIQFNRNYLDFLRTTGSLVYLNSMVETDTRQAR